MSLKSSNLSYIRQNAQGRRLGIPSGSPAGGGGPGARESAARGRDLSEEATLLTQPPRPYYFVWLTTGRTVRIECLVCISTILTEGRSKIPLG